MTREELRAKHGTPKAFERAVFAAIGEISVDEARVAVAKYHAEWGAARASLCPACASEQCSCGCGVCPQCGEPSEEEP